jgi:hypothetical protein
MCFKNKSTKFIAACRQRTGLHFGLPEHPVIPTLAAILTYISLVEANSLRAVPVQTSSVQPSAARNIYKPFHSQGRKPRSPLLRCTKELLKYRYLNPNPN